MSFEAVTSNILKEAINSAIYIDDKVLLPYEEERDGFKPDKIYNSLRRNECSLDIYRYNNEGINELEKFLYFNRDLLILDWHLDPSDEDNMKPTFGILEKAIGAKNLHFCVIYTSEKVEDLQGKVIYNIASYFSGLKSDICEKVYDLFIEFIDNSGVKQTDVNAVIEGVSVLSKQLFFDFNNKEESKKVIRDIYSIIETFSSRTQFDAFLNGLSLPANSNKERLTCLGFILNRTETPEVPRPQRIIACSSDTLKVNSLFIKAYSKVDEGSDLYNEFKASVVKESNLFLSLLGLELRNRFRETSGFIGKDLEDVSQLAFFYHRKSHFDGHEDLFNEFLKDIWKDQVGSFLLEKDITLFSVLNEFSDLENIDEKLKQFDKSNPLHRDSIAQLNYVYNRLATERKVNDEIRFGDIFYFDIPEKSRTFLLCITPHCDCLRPGKIKNMYFFVEGKDIGTSSGVDKSDGDYISFIMDEGKVACVDWTNGTEDCKPFTLYIPDNRMEGPMRMVKSMVLGDNRELNYSTTLKENYAQRIANKAFSYPLRVGIDFASFKKH